MNMDKYGLKCGTSLRFWENRGWINKIDPYGWFSVILGIGQVEDQKMIKDKLINGKKIVNRFRGKLMKMIKNAGSKYDDYLLSPKIRQILLHWGMN